MLHHQSLGQMPRAGHDKLGIQQAERLQRHGRARPRGAVEDNRRRIEHRQQAEHLRPPRLEIDRTPASAGVVLGNDDFARGIAAGGDVGAKQPLVELTAGGEQRIANRFGIEPPNGKPRQPASLRIVAKRPIAGLARLTIRIGANNLPMYRLEAPAALDELGREPFE